MKKSILLLNLLWLVTFCYSQNRPAGFVAGFRIVQSRTEYQTAKYSMNDAFDADCNINKIKAKKDFTAISTGEGHI